MRHVIKLLFAVLFAVLFASCGTTRKVANETKQQQITSSVTTDIKQQSSTSDVANVTTNETDYSKAVIEFLKIEYSDGTEDIRTGADVQRDTLKHREREQTEPPNVPAGRSIKSVATGRVTIDNDKTKQTTVNEEKTEDAQTQTNISEQTSEDTQTKSKTEDKPKHGLFYWFGVVSCTIVAVIIIFFILRAIEKRRRWQSD
jgi:hypothetical protein